MVVVSVVTNQEDIVGFPDASIGDGVGLFIFFLVKMMQQLDRVNH